MKKQFESFEEFYPFYLSQHTHPINRLLHVVGTAFTISYTLKFLFTGRWYFIPIAFLIGHALGRAGHFFIEKNKTADVEYTLYNFMADWRMFYDVIRRRISLT